MATKYECDRCHHQDIGKENFGIIEYPYYSKSFYSGNLDDRRHVDLCKTCVSSLNDWLKPLPQVEGLKK